MNRESSLWGAPRIQDELVMLGHLSGGYGSGFLGSSFSSESGR